MTEQQLRLELTFAKRKAAQAVDRLRRDISAFGSPDRDVLAKAKATMARVVWLRDTLDAA